uniref:Uncharacterized protein n=1 Tax=Meloidogyne floridensis TaxID=298350 RepID=A0A915P2I9_9BILA
TPLNITSTLQPSTAGATGGGHGQLKSMDSGIGTEVTTTSMPSTAPIHGGIGRTASDLPMATVQQQQQQVQQQHSSIGPTRSQSMKGEAANQIKRGAKGAGSLGAADSADEQRPITSQLAVPSVSSLKSSSSSAQELSQAKFFKLYRIRIQTGFALRYILEAFHEFPHIVRGTEAVASSSTGTSSEEEARKMVELVERTAVADGDSDLEVNI